MVWDYGNGQGFVCGYEAMILLQVQAGNKI